MTDICARSVIHRRERDASHALAAFVAEHRAGDGSVRIALRLPVAVFAIWKAAIERRGIAEISSLRSSSDHFPTYSVTWSTPDGGPFPAFAGALAVERLKGSDCVGLVLCGNYVPPLGWFGALFDAVLGHRIAHAAVRDLVGAIAAYIEAPPAAAALRADGNAPVAVPL